MKRSLLCLVAAVPFLAALLPAQEPPPAKVLIAFSSYRERPKHPNIFFYEHDGVANGKIVGSVATTRAMASADSHPSLSHDGKWCAYTFELENNTSRIQFWDLQEKKLIDLPAVNTSPNAQMSPSLSGDGKLLAFAAWNRPGAVGPGWNVFLFDLADKKLVAVPDLNTSSSDDRVPSLSGDGRFLAFVSNRKGGAGLTDIYLYDRQQSKVIPLPGLNSKNMDTQPSLSADGNLIAFVSDRPGGSGGRDIYLYDRVAQKVLPTPGLNSKTDDFDPCVIVLKSAD